MSCRSCGSGNLRDLGPCAPVPDRLTHEIGISPGEYFAGRLLRCQHCGLGQRRPCLDDAALAAAYRNMSSEAMDYPFEDNCAWMAAREFLRQRWAAGGTRKILDIGCHTGAFLAGLPSEWRRFGVESAEAPVLVARQIHGVEIIADRFENIGSECEGQFDAVTLFDVVEHLADPAVALSLAAKLLKPGGLLIASTADLDAWTWKWSRGRHWYLQAPLHLSVASGEFFRYVAGAAGLECRKLVRVAHRRGDFRSRWRERMATLHWEARQRGGWFRIPQRLLQSLPGLRELRHMQSVPWSMRLKDHLFVVLERHPAQ